MGETELIGQVPTMLSHLIQAWIDDEDVANGDDKVDVPLTKPSLFFADKALVIDLVHHGQFSVVSGFETKTIPGLSALGGK